MIYNEEISHCAAGVRWLKHLYTIAAAEPGAPESDVNKAENGNRANDLDQSTFTSVPDWMVEARRYETVEAWFHSLVRRHFHGLLKPPFNEKARNQAGFLPTWYLPLSVAEPTVSMG